MRKLIYLSAFFVLLLFGTGCQKDTIEFTPDGTSTSVEANIFGVVLDEDFNPIEGANVDYIGHETQTDKYGIYKFRNVDVDSRHSFLTITKEGYFENTRTFRTSHSKTLSLKSQLLKKVFNRSISATAGGQISVENTTLTFPSNAIVIESSNEDYNGTVQLAVKYLDPSQYLVNDQMPGDLTGISTSNELMTLSSFGMIAIEMQSNTGEKLQIKAGNKVEISTTVPSSIIHDAPSSIPLWYFDHSLGLWVEEGKAQLVDGKYIGEVTHFSYWNYDVSEPSIVLSGKLIDQEGRPISGVHVWVSAVDQRGGGHGNTSADGSFSGQVAKDRVLKILVYSGDYECGYENPMFETTIGPFSEDTDLGEIVISLGEEMIVHVTGTLLNCDGEQVTNGFVRTSTFKYFEVTTGEFDISFPVCNPNKEISIIATDRETFKESAPIAINNFGNNDLGDISTCQNDVDFIKLACTSLNYSKTFTSIDSLQFYSRNGKTLLVGNQIDFLAIFYNDENERNVIDEGKFPIDEIEMVLSSLTDNIDFLFKSGTITIIKGGELGDRINGNFNFIAYKLGDQSITYDFTGSFLIQTFE